MISMSDIFIRRPVMTVLTMLTILLFGLIAYRQLPVSDLPNVDYPTINVTANLPGASPETMGASVATVLEKEFSSIAGIDSMSSVSTTGRTQITLQFSLERDIDSAAQDVQSAISSATRRLPDGMPAPPTFRKANPADIPILYISLSSPTLPLPALDRYGQTMSQRLSTIQGVAQVQVRGSQKYAVRVQLDPVAMQGLGIDVGEVAAAIDAQNSNRPMGQLNDERRRVTLQSNGQLNEAKEYAEIVVAVRAGRPVHLREIATVLDSVENDQSAAWFFTRDSKAQSIFLAVYKQPGMNTLAVAEAVKATLPGLTESLPASTKLTVLRDGSLPIKDSVEDIQFTMALTLALVVMVIFLFIRNISATVIPSLSLPMSIVGTFAVMYTLGYSLDNMSLMALTLSVGFVVDDSIVMLENIVRHMEMGKSRMQAALDGAKEVGFTIVSMTISLVAIFIPLFFLGGMMGRLFREFAVTIGIAVLVSGIISLTLTPMLASRFLREPHLIRHGKIYQATERIYQAMVGWYDRSLLFVLRHRLATLLFSLIMLAGTVYLFALVPKGFIPAEDRDMIMISTETAQDASWPSVVGNSMRLAAILQKNPNVDRFMVDVDSSAFMLVVLKPRAQRKESVDQVIQILRPQLNSVPGIRAMPINRPPVNIGGRRARSQYQMTLQAIDLDLLYSSAKKLELAMKEMPSLLDVSSDLQLENPELNIEINRDRALLLGISPKQVEETLYSAYGTRVVSTINGATDQYDVIMELQPRYRTDASVLDKLYVRSSQGKLVPLTSVAALRQGVGPLSINHTGQLPSVTLSFNTKPGVALGDILADLKKLNATVLPDGVNASFQGNAQQFQEAQGSMGWLLALAIVVIYIVLGILYESFIHPLTILTALPFAGFGAVLTLLLFNTELSIYAFVGIIMLIGLVKKNGIMMIDFAVVAQAQGKSAEEAIHEACIIRFRPIMMTTMAALMAGLPIALGYGAGAESRRPLGLAVVGGLLFSQTLTLYVTPVFYIYMEKLQQWLKGRSKKPRPPVSVV
ncbi:MAG: efflux RND transporter permease subunit [Desulforhopalus sp.]|nr:efflux RND transporter permease subunit [Desulforhopalus sp.]